MKWRMPMAMAATMQLSSRNIRKPEKKPIHMLGVISGILGMLWRWMNIQMNCEFSATIINRLKNAKSQ